MASRSPPQNYLIPDFSSFPFIGVGPNRPQRNTHFATDLDPMSGGYATLDAPHLAVQTRGSRAAEIQVNNAIFPVHTSDAVRLAGPWPDPNDASTTPYAQYQKQQNIRMHIAAQSGHQVRALMRETISMENIMVHIHNQERNATLLRFRYAGQTPAQRQADLELAEDYHQAALDHRDGTVSSLDRLIEEVQQNQRTVIVNGGTQRQSAHDKAEEVSRLQALAVKIITPPTSQGDNFANPANVPEALLPYHRRRRAVRQTFWHVRFPDFMFPVFWHARGDMAISETFDPINNPEMYRYGEHQWGVHANLLYEYFVGIEMDNDALRLKRNHQHHAYTVKVPDGARCVETGLANFTHTYNSAVLQDPNLGQRFVVNDLSRVKVVPGRREMGTRAATNQENIWIQSQIAHRRAQNGI